MNAIAEYLHRISIQLIVFEHSRFLIFNGIADIFRIFTSVCDCNIVAIRYSVYVYLKRVCVCVVFELIGTIFFSYILSAF